MWINSSIPTNKLPYIFFSFFAIMYEAKKNMLKEGEFGSYCFEKGVREKYSFEGKDIYLFELFCQWIDKGIFNEEIITDELKRRFLPQKSDLKWTYLHTPVWDLDYNTTMRGLELVLNESYNGKLTGYELYSLMQRLQFYIEHNLQFNVAINYEEISKGMDILIFKIKKENTESDFGRFWVESEFLRTANDNIKPLLLKLEYISENIDSWKNQNQFIQELKNNPLDLYSLELKVFNEFDDEMAQEFYNCYSVSNNEIKRSLSYSLLKMSFANTYGKGDFWLKSLETTIDNFGQLVTKLENLFKTESDPITKLIEQYFITSLNQKISELEQQLPKE